MANVILLKDADVSKYRVAKLMPPRASASILAQIEAWLQFSTYVRASSTFITRFMATNGVLSAPKCQPKFFFQYLEKDAATGLYGPMTSDNPKIQALAARQYADYRKLEEFQLHFMENISANSALWFKKTFKNLDSLLDLCPSFLDKGNEEREVQHVACKALVEMTAHNSKVPPSEEGPWENQYATNVQLWNEDGEVILTADGSRPALIHEVVRSGTLVKPCIVPAYAALGGGQVHFVWKVMSMIVQYRGEQIFNMLLDPEELEAREQRRALKRALEEQREQDDAQALVVYEDSVRKRKTIASQSDEE